MSSIQVIGLPPREGQALELTALGMTTKLAAKQMQCSPRNVEALIHICMERLGACNRTHLITRAIQEGVLRVLPALALAITFCITGPIDARTPPRPVRPVPQVRVIARSYS